MGNLYEHSDKLQDCSGRGSCFVLRLCGGQPGLHLTLGFLLRAALLALHLWWKYTFVAEAVQGAALTAKAAVIDGVVEPAAEAVNCHSGGLTLLITSNFVVAAGVTYYVR